MTTMQVWARVGAAGEWNGSPTADPTTQVGGISVPYTGLPVYAFGGGMIFEFGDSDRITVNFGGTTFVGTVPAGFVPWGAGDTWNPASVAPGTQLTNGNLSISNNGSFTSFANSIGSNLNSPVYFECTLNHLLETINTGSHVGLETLSGPESNAEAQFNVSPNPCSWSINGGANINFGNSTGVGTVICIAAIIGTPAPAGLPIDLIAIAETISTIEVQWTPGGGTVTSYTLQFRQTGTTPWTQITNLPGMTYTVGGLLAATEYDFQVEAIGPFGNSGFTATTQATTLAIPVGISAGVADLFFTATASFIDLDNAANRALFITPQGRAQYLGADGSGALGVPPAVFLTVTGGGLPATADTFASNNGAGGAFSETNGPLAFTPTNPPGASAVAPPSNNMVGDFQNGNIYAFNLDENLDNGVQRKWLRTWRATQQATLQPQRFSCLTVDIETGIDVPDGTAPQLMLRWSDDGGHNWSNTMIRAAGPVGATAQRVMFKRLGSTRRGTGLDRIFELSCTDPFRVAIIRAEFEP
jgi:hypothetical protein